MNLDQTSRVVMQMFLAESLTDVVSVNGGSFRTTRRRLLDSYKVKGTYY